MALLIDFDEVERHGLIDWRDIIELAESPGADFDLTA